MACSSASVGLEDFDTGEIEAGGESLAVAVADTAGERRQGLRGVEGLPEGIDGMLFVFDEPTRTNFEMEDTLIPLDLWWFDSDGRLLGSAGMEPCDTATCLSYGSPGEVSWALETPSGQLELVPGDMLKVITTS